MGCAVCPPPQLPGSCGAGAVHTAMGEEGCARCFLQPPRHAQFHFSLCLLLCCCFLQCGGFLEPIPSCPASKLFSDHLCCDSHHLDTSTWSFSCVIWGCVSRLRFLQPLSYRWCRVLGSFGARSEQTVSVTSCGAGAGGHTEPPAILLCSMLPHTLPVLARAGMQCWSLPGEHIRSCCPGRASGAVFGQQSPACRRTCCSFSLWLPIAEMPKDGLGGTVEQGVPRPCLDTPSRWLNRRWELDRC